MREFVRVFKLQIEEKAAIALASDDVILLWMIRWAAMVPSRYMIGRDGRTPYERRRGRKCKIPVMPFGESVWYKQLKEKKERQGKLWNNQQGVLEDNKKIHAQLLLRLYFDLSPGTKNATEQRKTQRNGEKRRETERNR